MIRSLFTGLAAFALMTGAAVAQDYHRDNDRYYRDYDGYHRDYGDRVAGNTVRGGLGGAGLGAVIGCLVTIPIGCAPGAAVGAAVGGGGGAVVGAASTRDRYHYRRDRDYYPSDDR
jgi:hypothetical protein